MLKFFSIISLFANFSLQAAAADFKCTVFVSSKHVSGKYNTPVINLPVNISDSANNSILIRKDGTALTNVKYFDLTTPAESLGDLNDAVFFSFSRSQDLSEGVSVLVGGYENQNRNPVFHMQSESPKNKIDMMFILKGISLGCSEK